MIRLVLTLVVKLSLQFVFWLLIFSIKINEKTLHVHTLEYIEKNKILHSVGEKAEKLWYNVRGVLSRNVGGAGSDDQLDFEPASDMEPPPE